MERLPFSATTAGTAYDDIDKLPVALLLENVRSLYNVGSLFRTADAAGVSKIVLTGITGRPPHKGIKKTALGAEERVSWVYVPDSVTAASDLQAEDFHLAVLETTLRAHDLFDWQPRFPVCIVLGHEVDGVSAPLLEKCDTHVRIPMLGLKHSLNVATAGGVVLYELLRKYRRMLESTKVIT
ncbi:MAG TPA: RNA methyltransferase [Bryobacteraceae bacterium]|nr:RNA methyltransferase [Bryobacteraceae bacterium]